MRTSNIEHRTSNIEVAPEGRPQERQDEEDGQSEERAVGPDTRQWPVVDAGSGLGAGSRAGLGEVERLAAGAVGAGGGGDLVLVLDRDGREFDGVLL